MNVHKNARLTPLGREWIVRQVESGRTPEAVSLAAGVCPRTVRKWVERFRAEGLAGLQDRSSRPHRLYRPTPEETVQRIKALRYQRLTGQQIASETGVSAATVSRVLRRLRLSRAKDLQPPEPVRRYERAHPGELIHIDIKKLGRCGSERTTIQLLPDSARDARQRKTAEGAAPTLGGSDGCLIAMAGKDRASQNAKLPHPVNRLLRWLNDQISSDPKEYLAAGRSGFAARSLAPNGRANSLCQKQSPARQASGP
jgi:transposase